MDAKYIHADGSPVNTSNCVVPDHHVVGFTVRVRAMQPVHVEALKRLIQSQFEVVDIEPVEHTIVVR